MWMHRVWGIGLAGVGLAVLVGQLLVLYGVIGDSDVMVRIGLPGTAVLSSLGAISFSSGCLLAAAPRSTMRHTQTALRHTARVAGALRRR